MSPITTLLSVIAVCAAILSQDIVTVIALFLAAVHEGAYIWASRPDAS